MGNVQSLLEALEYPFDSPDTYFHRFDLETADLVFIRMNRELFAKSTFLDDRLQRLDGQEARVPFAALWKHYRDIECNDAPAGIVFHTAYCGSTLLARAIDVVPSVLVLREPVALLQLALGAVTPPPEYEVADLLELACALYSRTYPEAESQVAIKVSSVCGVLGRGLVREGRAVLLYADLVDSILSHLKHPGRIKEARAFFPAFTSALTGSPLSPQAFSDSQVIAINWSCLVHPIGVLTGAQVATRVTKSNLLASPVDTIGEILSSLKIRPAEDLAQRLREAQTFSLHSKSSGTNQKEFDANAREDVMLSLAEKHAGELKGIDSWLDDWLEKTVKRS